MRNWLHSSSPSSWHCLGLCSAVYTLCLVSPVPQPLPWDLRHAVLTAQSIPVPNATKLVTLVWFAAPTCPPTTESWDLGSNHDKTKMVSRQKGRAEERLVCCAEEWYDRDKYHNVGWLYNRPKFGHITGIYTLHNQQDRRHISLISITVVSDEKRVPWRSPVQ